MEFPVLTLSVYRGLSYVVTYTWDRFRELRGFKNYQERLYFQQISRDWFYCLCSEKDFLTFKAPGFDSLCQNLMATCLCQVSSDQSCDVWITSCSQDVVNSAAVNVRRVSSQWVPNYRRHWSKMRKCWPQPVPDTQMALVNRSCFAAVEMFLKGWPHQEYINKSVTPFPCVKVKTSTLRNWTTTTTHNIHQHPIQKTLSFPFMYRTLYILTWEFQVFSILEPLFLRNFFPREMLGTD